MIEDVEQQIRDLKELLKTPTPGNFEAANQKLTHLSTALQTLVSEPTMLNNGNAGDIALLSRLPGEMAHIHQLFQAPVKYLHGLALFRVQKFGAYNCQGQMNSLGQGSLARTITQL